MKRDIRSAYSDRPEVNNPEPLAPSRTKQEFKKEVNINSIISKMKNGISPPAWMTQATPRYGDFSNMPTSFMDAYNLIEKAEAAFESLPLEFRRALDHNPANLDKAPRELFERFGLLKTSERAEAPNGAVEPGSTQRVQGDRDLPVKGAPAPKNPPKKGAQTADE